MFLNEGEAIWLTAQEAAERTQTIRIAGILLFVIVVFGCMWLIIRYKSHRKVMEQNAVRDRIEAENASERIRVTENLGTAMTTVLKEDSGWKVQYYALKAKYDTLSEHCASMENTLATATGANGFKPQEA